MRRRTRHGPRTDRPGRARDRLHRRHRLGHRPHPRRRRSPRRPRLPHRPGQGAAASDQLGTAMILPHSLADPATSQAAAEAIMRTWGRLDVLVTSAWASPGWAPPDHPAEATPASAWQDQMRINAEGTAYTVQAVLAPMRAAGWGRIVLLSSGAADGAPGLEQYAAAKAALHGLARSLARSAGKAGILANIVMPGLIPTERNRQRIPQPALDQIAAATPTGRLATEDDVARLVTFLASAANTAITGA